MRNIAALVSIEQGNPDLSLSQARVRLHATLLFTVKPGPRGVKVTLPFRSITVICIKKKREEASEDQPLLIIIISFLFLQKFRTHNIDGTALLQLTESHLVDVMKLSLGPVVKLTNAVADKIR